MPLLKKTKNLFNFGIQAPIGIIQKCSFKNKLCFYYKVLHVYYGKYLKV